MTWFKVDDGFYDHPKVAALPNAAVGLWVKAGAWCAKHLTDGVISATQVRALKGSTSQISALLESGLWFELSSDRTQSGRKSYAFRDWNDFNPNKADRLAERSIWAEKKRNQRGRNRSDQGNGENVPGGLPPHVPGGHSHSGGKMSPGDSRKCPVPDPTRPVERTNVLSRRYGDTRAGAAGGGSATEPADENSRSAGAPAAGRRQGFAPADWLRSDEPAGSDDGVVDGVVVTVDEVREVG